MITDEQIDAIMPANVRRSAELHQHRWRQFAREVLALQPSASAEPVQAEAIARRFHEAYERLAPSFGYTTRQDTREWSPESTNGQLMIAVCEELFASPVTAAREQEASATGAEPAFYISRKQLPLLGKTPAPYVAYRMAPEGNFDTAVYLATPTTSTTGKVDASRVRALIEYEIWDWWASENGLEDHDMCKLDDFREVVRAVEKKLGIGTPKSAEGEGA